MDDQLVPDRTLQTSARLLRLLGLLHTDRDWTGPQLADRLGVSPRTVRNDVRRLRSLGYPLHSTNGTTGGYRLGSGAALPPLLLDDDEAVSLAVSLRAAGGAVTGIEEISARLLAKLEHVLPTRLRHRVAALAAAVVSLPTPGPRIDGDALCAVAGAILARERLRFSYADQVGATTRRDAEPHRLVHVGRHLYLLAWDVDHRDWCTFRIDRMTPTIPTGQRFAPRDPPVGDIAGYVSRDTATATGRYRARVRLHAAAAAVADRITPAIGTVEPLDAGHCVLATGADTLPMLAHHLALRQHQPVRDDPSWSGSASLASSAGHSPQ